METITLEYRRQFCLEVRDILEQVNQNILQAETDPGNLDLINAIFRGIHTIKGSAGVFDLDELSAFAHHLEGLLNLLREGRAALDSGAVDLILQGADTLMEMVEACERGETVVADSGLVDRLRARVEAISQKAEPSGDTVVGEHLQEAVLPPIPDTVLPPLKEAFLQGKNTFAVRLEYPADYFANGFDPLVLLNNLREEADFFQVVTDIGKIPALAEFEPLSLYLAPEIYLTTELNADEICDLALDPAFIAVHDLAPVLVQPENLAPAVSQENLQEFLNSTEEMLDRLENAVMGYEAAESAGDLNEIFRIVHTLKGDANYIGLENLVRFAHALESLLEILRTGRCKRSPKIIEILLGSHDFIRDAVARLARGQLDLRLPSLVAEINQLVTDTGQTPAGPNSGCHGISNDVGTVFIEQALQHRKILAEHADPLPLDAERRQIVRRSLKSLACAADFVGVAFLQALTQGCLEALAAGDDSTLGNRLADILAVIDGFNGEPKKLGQILLDQGSVSGEALQQALGQQKKLGTLLVENGAASPEVVERALKTQECMEAGAAIRQSTSSASRSENRTMRVDETKIDQFSNTIGELVVARNGLEYLIYQLGTIPEMPAGLLKNFKDTLHRVSRVTNDMQADVTGLRMIPIRGIFQKFTRVVRDIAKKQDKQIDFVIDGEDTEIDKKVADILSDPLIHMVRNSCDHGIETPAERQAAGKPEQGTLLLRANQEGSNLIITINDDGRGVDRQKLRAKAVTMGLAVESGDEDSLLGLIFAPGLSTREQVSDLSGRGVGMDVVNTTLNQLGGSVKVASEQGQGTSITLTIPMTMGISEALLVQSGGKPYAIPLDYVAETLKLPRHRLHRLHDRLGFNFRNEVIPTDTLEAMLGSQSNRVLGEVLRGDPEEELAVIILRCDRGKFGAIVDRLDKNVELAIKPVPEALAGIDVISGVSILVDGSVVLTLNPDKLV